MPQEDEGTCFFLVAVLALGGPRLAALLFMASLASKRPSNGRSATLWGEWDGERKTWFLGFAFGGLVDKWRQTGGCCRRQRTAARW